MKEYKLRRRAPARETDGIDWDAALNPQQLAVVTAGTGPTLVIAGAGSGKTHTLTYRVARLLSNGVPPESVLLLTFTNKAARAMMERVGALVGDDVKRRMWGGTFHHIGHKIVRRWGKKLGYPDNFTVLDPADAALLMKGCLHETGVDVTKKRYPRGNTLHQIFSYCINTGSTVEEALAERAEDYVELADDIRDVFHTYQSRKLELGCVDFDDLLLLWKRLMVEFPDVRHEISSRFEHVLVDEYQDTNRMQGELVELAASVHGNLMVVGDDCQSIYRFRGAEYRNILEFPDRHAGCHQYRLETNYRSTPEIVDLTNRSIANNVHQFQKTLVAERPCGERPALLRLRDVGQQAAFVCERILDLADDGVSLDDIAVLYRAHYHSTELQIEMARYGIPFVIRSGVRFFEQAHIKDVLSYLKFIFNPRDEISFRRIAQHYNGIGGARAHDLWKVIRDAPDPLAAATDPQLGNVLPDRYKDSWHSLSGTLGKLRSQRLTSTPAHMIDSVMSGNYPSYLEKSFEKSENRLGDLEQLTHYAGQWDDLDRFLGEVVLMSEIAGQDILVGGDQPDEHVTLTSIHQAKGLEWKACFVLWLSDGHFPSANAADDEDGFEEERRLFYVATTRAKDELYLCHVVTHRRRDHRLITLRESPFIEELREDDPADEPWEAWKIEQGF